MRKGQVAGPIGDLFKTCLKHILNLFVTYFSSTPEISTCAAAFAALRSYNSGGRGRHIDGGQRKTGGIDASVGTLRLKSPRHSTAQDLAKEYNLEGNKTEWGQIVHKINSK